MRDEDKGSAFALHFFQNFKQVGNLLIAQSCGGLVENQEFCVGMECPANFQQLLFTGLQFRDHNHGVHIHTQPLKELSGLGDHLLFLKNVPFIPDFPVQENVLIDSKIVDDAELLMHKGNACLLHLANGGLCIDLAVKFNPAFVHGNNTGENVHQRGFARAVLTQQGMDFALFHIQMHIHQSVDAAEGFGNALHLQNCVHMHFS